MDPINPEEFRYIKLGRGGSWVQPAFERGELHFGYPTVVLTENSVHRRKPSIFVR